MTLTEIHIAGDPILDRYIYGTVSKKRFFEEPEKTEEYLGGAANVVENVMSCLSNYGFDKKIKKSFCNYYSEEYPTFTRFIVNNKLYFEHFDRKYKTTQYNHDFECFWKNGSTTTSFPHSFNKYILCVSDYNKGSCGKGFLQNTRFKYEYCVVDSKYRSCDLDFLKNCKVKIWRCTGKEYDEAWAGNFDYVIHTNAAKPVRLIDVKTNSVTTIPILNPAEKVVDTVGAGDTFTAAITSCIAYSMRFNKNLTLKEAIEYANHLCQIVIQEQFTRTADITVEDYFVHNKR